MSRSRLPRSATLLSASVCLVSGAAAAQPAAVAETALPEVVVVGEKPQGAATAGSGATTLGAFTLSGEPLAAASAATGDTGAMLTAVPGVQTATGGGVSGLPVMRGLADDRINILNMGMALTSACANHMNPSLSYVDPSAIGGVEVLSGVTPVSKGGDSIAGTIVVEPKAPRFAAPGAAFTVHGSVSAFYRSNGDGLGGAVTLSAATPEWALDYSGSGSQARNYVAGGGTVVRSTEYAAQNHLLALSKKTADGVLTATLGVQHIPYQGFVNQRMDMTDNRGLFGTLRYWGDVAWGRLDASVFWHHTDHYMNFLDDKGGSTTTTGMPMYTRGNDLGWSVKTEIDWSKDDVVRFGNELHAATLDDWWPPVAGKPGMCCSTFENIHDGRRIRVGTFAEWEHVWSKEWTTLVGVRNDTVWMDTGDVQGYNIRTDMPGMFLYPLDAAAFNARGHAKTDVNFDLTVLARWTPTDRIDTEFGYARKTRSPNVYERYAWSTSRMAAAMTTWFGDANGYVGDIDLKPEVAHTLSATLKLHDPTREAWSLEVKPHYSYVENYIDADRITSTSWAAPNPFVLLKFANHDAELWGFEAAARARIATSETWGAFDLTGRIAYTRGRNLDTGDGLYRVMPLEGRIGLDHRLGAWASHVDLQMVADKNDVSDTRKELRTAGYALLNVRTGYEWKNLRFDVGVDNVFDQSYRLPLGGVDFTTFKTTGVVQGVAGPGRAVWAVASVKF